jgi:hypothetical protein
MKILKKSLSDISNERTLRFDVSYQSYQAEKEFYNFSEIFCIVDEEKIDIECLKEEIFYSEIGNVDKGGFVFPVLVDLNTNNFEQNRLIKKIKKNDIQKPADESILIPKVRPNLKKFVYVEYNNDIYYTKAFINIKPKIKPIVSYYMLLTEFTNSLVSVARIGKSYPSISEKDLLSIKFPKRHIDNLKNISISLEKKILKLHIELRDLENKVFQEENSTRFIDDIFEKHIGLNVKKLEKLKLNKVKIVKFSDFSNNIDLRFSVRFHRESGRYATDMLSKDSYRIKDVISTVTMTGKEISPKDYEESTDCFYLSMGDITSWKIDYNNLKTVSKDYENNNLYKKPQTLKEPQSTKLEKGDIVMMRSGEGGIGKVALVDKDINAIFSDFIIRFRFEKDKYIPKFCYYYMRSTYFQYLIEIHKKGLGNNTNIFPSNVNEFPIPMLSVSEQNNIINDIIKKKRQTISYKQRISDIQKEIHNLLIENVYY